MTTSLAPAAQIIAGLTRNESDLALRAADALDKLEDDQLGRWSCRTGAYLVADAISHEEFGRIVKHQNSIDAMALHLQRAKRMAKQENA